jgi:hypothetical protein
MSGRHVVGRSGIESSKFGGKESWKSLVGKLYDEGK